MEQVINYLPNWSQKQVATGSTVYKDSHKCTGGKKEEKVFHMSHREQRKERWKNEARLMVSGRELFGG